MELLLKLLALWGIVDAIWMAVDPGDWGQFWGRFIGIIGRGGIPARLLALLQGGFSLYLLVGQSDDK